jgi:hypothetical protein
MVVIEEHLDVRQALLERLLAQKKRIVGAGEDLVIARVAGVARSRGRQVEPEALVERRQCVLERRPFARIRCLLPERPDVGSARLAGDEPARPLHVE